MTSAHTKTDSQAVLEREEVEDVPRLPEYAVILHNDDFTPQEFVVQILQLIFHHNPASAEAIMLAIHSGAEGVCGIYVEEVAETKMHQVRHIANEHGHPLLCTIRLAGPQSTPGRPRA